MTAQANRTGVKFGVLLPTREAVMSGRSDPAMLFHIAERAEVLGFHSLWVGDSLTARPRVDALTTLSAVGARTSRVRLGTAIFLAALRLTIAAGGRDAVIEGERFLAEYYNRTYEAIVKAGLCLAGSWDEVLDRLEALIDVGARTVVLRFAARDQLEQVEKCAEALHRRGWLG